MSAVKAGPTSAVTILAYHRIGPADGQKATGDTKLFSATQAGLSAQFDFLKQNFEVLSFEELVAANRAAAHSRHKLPPNTAVITFDDGNLDNYDLAFPILRQKELPATIYLITSMVGSEKQMWWDEAAVLVDETAKGNVVISGLGQISLGSPRDRTHAKEKIRAHIKALPGEQREGQMRELRIALAGDDPHRSHMPRMYLNWDEVRDMRRNGVSFGAHTHTHPILTTITPEMAENEVRISQEIIDKMVDQSARLFAYPNGRRGDFNHQTRSILARLGFDAAVTLVPGINFVQKDLDWLALKRVYVGADDPIIFQAKVTGALDSVLRRFPILTQLLTRR